MVPVFLYVPNLIGYFRAISGVAAFYFVDSNPIVFYYLYFVSYILDAFDGVAARHLNQCSKFGAVLDMVCDRFCTAALYLALCNILPEKKYFYILMSILDIVSHWIQMYSASLVNKSHKQMDKEENALLRFYYSVPYALFFVCILNEYYIMSEYMVYYLDRKVVVTSFEPVWKFINVWFKPVFLFKQLVSVVAMIDSSNKIVKYDEEERAAKEKSK